MFEAYVFDLDGTLIDSRADIIQSVNATLCHFGKKEISLEKGIRYVGKGSAHLIEKLLPGEKAEMIVAATNYFIEYYDAHPADSVTIYEGVTYSLDALQHAKKYVVTNKSEKIAKKILDKLDLTKYFKKLIGGDTYPILKPDPYALHHIIKEDQLKQSSILMVGDTDIDILFGKNANIKTCRFLSNYGAMGSTREVKEDYTINNFPEILALKP